MKTKIKKEKLIAATVVVLLAVSMAGMFFYHHANKDLKSGLNDEKLKSESLLSEKLALAKEIEKLYADIESWRGKNQYAEQMLEEAKGKLKSMENTIAALRKENAVIASLKKELNELAQIRKDLEAQLASADHKSKNSAKKIDDLTSELASVKAERDELKNLKPKPSAENLTDNFRIETTRGKKKQKLTVNAARTKKLVVSFEIPQSMTSDVSFSIITPQGNLIKSDNPKLKTQVIEDDRSLTASLSPITGEFEISRRIEMSYLPDQKLEPGIYKIQIHQKDKKVGNCQIRLR